MYVGFVGYDFRVRAPGIRGLQEIVTPDKTPLLEQQVPGRGINYYTPFKNWRKGERQMYIIILYKSGREEGGLKKICF